MPVPKKYALKCPNCGRDIDLRDLSDVMHHELKKCITGKKKKKVQFSASKKKGDPILWVKGKKPINLN